ncbi:MAG: acyltransferase [Kiritimatiellae bacterium]|nr:acyltransferase [Kiritimatiellia bacterium]
MKTSSSVRSISPELSAKLTVVSFISACFVVILHAYEKSLAVGTGPTAWIVTFVGWTLPTFAVPIFFVISGFLLGVKSGNGTKDGWYAQALRKRVRTLLVPYLIWCTIYALTVVPFTMFGNHLAGRSLVHNTHLHEPVLSWWNLFCIYGADMSGFPANGVLWYVRNLLILVLIAPPLIKFLANKWLGFLLLLIFGATFFLHDWMPRSYWQFFETGFSLRGFFYFLLGLFLAAHPIDNAIPRQLRSLVPFAWLVVGLFFTYLRLYSGGDSLTAQRLLAKTANLLGVGAIWILYDLIPSARRLAKFSVTHDSFFLYAAHLGIIFTVLCAKSQDILSSRLHIPSLGIFIIRFAVPILLSLTIAELLKRYCPRVYALLTGGR